jgi:cystathionine beta-lyase/cystathionine gamma-synthase
VLDMGCREPGDWPEQQREAVCVRFPQTADRSAMTPDHLPELGENTRAVHLPPPPAVAQQPLGTPVYRTAAFAFGSSAEYAAVLNDATPGYSYSRIDNPTVDAFATAVAALEGAGVAEETAAQAFASGMAAVSAVFWTFTGAGAHVVAPSALYGGTYGFLRHVAARFGVSTSFVDITDLSLVRAAIQPATRIVYAETLANPTVAVADLASLAAIAHEAGALLVVDSTLAPPVMCRPLEYGADLVLHSATKYLGGHSDVTGGVVSGRPGLIRRVRATRIDTGGSLAPDEAYLLRRGLETLPVRVARQCATALAFAQALSGHPMTAAVDYPGLPGHPGHELARRQFSSSPEGTRFGAIVTITPRGGREAGQAFADGLRVAQVATSLGGTHTKVAVRFSIGLEDAGDLIADARQALDALAAGAGPQPQPWHLP